MELLGSAAVVVLIAGLWIAAVLFGRDTRDGGDWFARSRLAERPRRLGD
jgi:hypothetical protein